MKIDESKLMAYFNNQLSQSEQNEVEKWIVEDSKNWALANDVEKIHLASSFAAKDKNSHTSTALTKIKSRIRHNRRTRIIRVFQRAAAVAFLPFFLLSAYFAHELKRENESIINVTSTTGLISSVTLPDSTKVWLNSNSTISYSANFRGKERKVTLTGEAFFAVKPDAKKKFVVEARGTATQVLGTEFNIEAYPNSEYVRTTLVSGVVEFLYTEGSSQLRTMRLSPGDQVVYHINNKETLLRQTETDVLTSWKEGNIILRETLLEEVLRQLENKYNVAFVITDNALKENSFTGKFVNQNLDIILKKITLSSGIRFREVKSQLNQSERTCFEVY